MIFKTGNGIISPTSRPLIKTSLYDFSNFQDTDKKTFFCKKFSLNVSKLIFKTGNGIIKTGNGIISPTSWPLIKNFFYWMFLIWSKELDISFWNRQWNHPNRKWNYCQAQPQFQLNLAEVSSSLNFSTPPTHPHHP